MHWYGDELGTLQEPLQLQLVWPCSQGSAPQEMQMKQALTFCLTTACAGIRKWKTLSNCSIPFFWPLFLSAASPGVLETWHSGCSGHLSQCLELQDLRISTRSTLFLYRYAALLKRRTRLKHSKSRLIQGNSSSSRQWSWQSASWHQSSGLVLGQNIAKKTSYRSSMNWSNLSIELSSWVASLQVSRHADEQDPPASPKLPQLCLQWVCPNIRQRGGVQYLSRHISTCWKIFECRISGRMHTKFSSTKTRRQSYQSHVSNNCVVGAGVLPRVPSSLHKSGSLKKRIYSVACCGTCHLCIRRETGLWHQGQGSLAQPSLARKLLCRCVHCAVQTIRHKNCWESHYTSSSQNGDLDLHKSCRGPEAGLLHAML